MCNQIKFTSPRVRESQLSGAWGSKVCKTSILSGKGGKSKDAPTDNAPFTAFKKT